MDATIDLAPYMALAKSVAKRMWIECGGKQAMDELESEAMLALVKCRDIYDPSRGEFGKFARFKIRFMLFDWIRATSPLSRQAVQEAKAGKRPMIATHSIEVVLGDNDTPLAALLESAREPDGLELREDVDAALRPLAQVDREILRMYYIDDLTMKQIAAKLDLSEGRISQRMQAATNKLQGKPGGKVMSEKNGKFSLEKMKEKTPPVNPVEAMRKQLALSVYSNVGEKDIAAMMNKLKEMALGGNLGAMKMYLKLTIGEGNDKLPEPPTETPGAAALARAIEDLVDEIRITKAEQAKLENDPLLNKSARRITQMADGEDE